MLAADNLAARAARPALSYVGRIGFCWYSAGPASADTVCADIAWTSRAGLEPVLER